MMQNIAEKIAGSGFFHIEILRLFLTSSEQKGLLAYCLSLHLQQLAKPSEWHKEYVF